MLDSTWLLPGSLKTKGSNLQGELSWDYQATRVIRKHRPTLSWNSRLQMEGLPHTPMRSRSAIRSRQCMPRFLLGTGIPQECHLVRYRKAAGSAIRRMRRL